MIKTIRHSLAICATLGLGCVLLGVGLQPASATAEESRFVGVATVTLATAPNGTAFATLYISAPLTVLETSPDGNHVGVKLWMKDSTAPGTLYIEPNGIAVGRVLSVDEGNFQSGTKAYPVDPGLTTSCAVQRTGSRDFSLQDT